MQRAAGADILRDVEPGELVIVDSGGTRSVSPFPQRPRTTCVHEAVSLARTDARAQGQPVYALRAALGASLAAEQPCPTAHAVVAIGDVALPAAAGYAQRAGLRLEVPGDLLVPAVVDGRSLVAVASSLATGDDVRAAVARWRRAGAREVHVRVASPLVRAGCGYGVASPTSDELLATGTVTLLSRLGADSVALLSTEAFRAVVGERGWCDGCFSGEWPIARSEADDQLPLF